MRIPIVNSTSQGMVRDLSDTNLGLEQWTYLEGVRLTNGKLARIAGPEPVGLDVDIEPTGIWQFRRGGEPTSLFLVDADSILFTNGTTLIDVSGTSAPYGAATNGWTFTNFNGVPILNPATKVPQAGETFPLAAVVDLSNWPATWLAGSIRSFKTLLIAMNLTIAGTESTQEFAFSNLVEDPFVVPSDWDFADPESVAGLQVLADTEGPLVDGASLRELFVMYKDRQAYVLTLSGANVFAIYPTFTKGLIAKNCIATIPTSDGPRHFCVGQEDIYLSNGYTEQSLSNERLTDWFYREITVGLETHVHVKHHQAEREVWVMFPRGEAATGCNYVLIYKYGQMPGFTLFPLAAGVVTVEPSLFNIAVEVDDSFDADSGAFDDDPSRFDALAPTFNVGRLTAVEDGSLVYLDQADTCDATAIIERTGLAITGKDYKGNPTYDPDVYKLVNDVWPRFSGAGEVAVSVPVQELPDGTVTYAGPWSFAIGDKRVEDAFAAGNLIGIRFESLDDSPWSLIGYDIELEAAGA